MFDVSLSHEERIALVDGRDEDAHLMAALVATLLAHERAASEGREREERADGWRLMGRWQQLLGTSRR